MQLRIFLMAILIINAMSARILNDINFFSISFKKPITSDQNSMKNMASKNPELESEVETIQQQTLTKLELKNALENILGIYYPKGNKLVQKVN